MDEDVEDEDEEDEEEDEDDEEADADGATATGKRSGCVSRERARYAALSTTSCT